MRRRVIISVIVAISICGIAYAIYAWSGIFTYGGMGISDMELSSTEGKLYVSYHLDNVVVEVDNSAMEESRRFNIVAPGRLVLDESDSFLYVTSLWPGKINRVNLLNGQISSINLGGEAVSAFLDEVNDKLWVVHRTWPLEGDIFSPSHLGSHPNTGFFTEIDTANFSIIGTYETSKLPSCIWYSEYAHKLYVYHEYRAYNWESVVFRGGLISSYNMGPGGPTYTGGPKGGLQDFIDELPMTMTDWTGEGRYFAVPARDVTKPGYTLRVFDTADDSVALDYSIPGEDDEPIMIFDLEREVGTDYIWVIIQPVSTPQGGDPDTRYIARIDTTTQDYTLYPVLEASSWIGCLEIASLARKAYMSMPMTGEIIVMDLE